MSKKVDLLQLFIKEHVKIISYDPGYGKQLAFSVWITCSL